MTDLLSLAISKAEELTSSDQDAIAALILEGIADDQAWSKKFATSERELSIWASKVRQDIAAGRLVDQSVEDL